MPLDIPDDAEEVELRAKTDVQRELPESNPFLKNSWIGALITGYANRIFDYYIQLREAIRLAFPDTTSGTFLERWAAIYGLQRLPASIATGNVIATGAVGSSIPVGTQLSSSDGKIYENTATVLIANQVVNVINLTRTGNVATAQTASPHLLSSNVPVTIAGADQPEYNVVDAAITVISDDQFTYLVSGSPISPATGTITAEFDTATVNVQSVEFGADQDQAAGAELKLQSPLIGVDNSLFVDFGRIGGGADQESDTALQIRMLNQIQNPIAHFNASDIDRKAREVPGVTRVFVQDVTPALGQVTILFMRDNDTNPIPAGSEITDVKDKILEIKPANTGDADVIVIAPTPVSVDFTFSSLSPNTVTMQNAITANLQQFFAEDTEVAVDIEEDAYRSVIFNTIDLETGQKVDQFDLTIPIGDITISTDEIGVLGAIIYP